MGAGASASENTTAPQFSGLQVFQQIEEVSRHEKEESSTLNGIIEAGSNGSLPATACYDALSLVTKALEARTPEVEPPRWSKERMQAKMKLDASKDEMEESKLRGIQLAWACEELHSTAWHKIKEKQTCVKEGKLTAEQRQEEKIEKILDKTEDDVSEMNFYDLDPVLAHTRTGIGFGKLCPRDRLPHCSIVDGFYRNDGTGFSNKATIFMSWVWTYKLLDVVTALKNWHYKNSAEQRMEHHFIWWCFFCNNQYRLCDEQEDPNQLADIFAKRLIGIGKMLITLDTLFNPKYAERAWCLFEIWVAWKHNISELQVALSQDAVDEFQSYLTQGKFELHKHISIDSKKADATQKADLDFIMMQMKGRHDEVDKAVGDALLLLVSVLVRMYSPTFSTKDQIKTLTGHLQEGRLAAGKCEGKDLILFIGNTGSGKSTTVNALQGCKMKRIKEHGELKVKVAEESDIPEATRIGHTCQSETKLPTLIQFDNQCLCDCPGFEDRRGSDISVTNTVNLHHVLKAATSAKFVVLAAYPAIVADRGKGLDDILQLLLDLFGSKQDLKQYEDTILLCLTKTPRFDEDGEIIKRRDVIAHFKARGDLKAHFRDDDVVDVLYNICQRCVVFHPIEKPDESWVDREGLLMAIASLKGMRAPSDTCILVPNALEAMTLRNSFRSYFTHFEELYKESSRIEQHLEASSFLGEITQLQDLLFSGMKLHRELVEVQVGVKEMLDAGHEKLNKHYREITEDFRRVHDQLALQKEEPPGEPEESPAPRNTTSPVLRSTALKAALRADTHGLASSVSRPVSKSLASSQRAFTLSNAQRAEHLRAATLSNRKGR